MRGDANCVQERGCTREPFNAPGQMAQRPSWRQDPGTRETHQSSETKKSLPRGRIGLTLDAT